MPENNKKAKKAVKRPVVAMTPEARATLGVVEKFDEVPGDSRGKYPWATVSVGEAFNIPIGSRSGVGKYGKKYGKTFTVRDNGNGTARVYCTAEGLTTTTA